MQEKKLKLKMSTVSDRLEEALKLHLINRGCARCDENWVIKESEISGRGIFARRNISENDLVFVDRPLVVGPRTNDLCAVVCVCCGRNVDFTTCQSCFLPVCSPCQRSPNKHRFECEYIRRLKPKEHEKVEKNLYKSVTPIRCLKLKSSDRELVQLLQSNEGPRHSFEVDLLKNSVCNNPSKDDEDFMRQCCRVMDANAFATVAVQKAGTHRNHGSGAVAGSKSEDEFSLRGLYPLSALMNHSCSPNTRSNFDGDQRMSIRATKFIEDGQEITTSYTSLLWATPVRRQFLLDTKHFLCKCFRCQDPSELGTWLFAMDCPSRNCEGQIFPSDVSSLTSDWSCKICNRRISYEQSCILRNIRNAAQYSFNGGNPDSVLKELKEKSKSNQMVVENKLHLIWTFGHKNGFLWAELNEEMLLLKQRLCKDILDLMQALQLGLCRMKGLMLYELFLVCHELKRRIKSRNEDKIRRLAEEARQYLLEALAIIGQENFRR